MPRANGITRQEILSSIKNTGAKTAEELSRELGISQVAVRQHLASLEAENIILVNVERRGLGRPSHRYMLTAYGDEQFPRHYDLLALELIENLQANQGEEAVLQLFAKMRERLLHTLQNRLDDKSLAERVEEVAQIQTERGFMAEVSRDEGDPDAFLLVEHNCAFCAIARRYPRACCENEMLLFRSLIGDADIVREKHIVDGHHTCAYRIRPRPSA